MLITFLNALGPFVAEFAVHQVPRPCYSFYCSREKVVVKLWAMLDMFSILHWGAWATGVPIAPEATKKA
jgi:hypothetical protein